MVVFLDVGCVYVLIFKDWCCGGFCGVDELFVVGEGV